MKKSDDIREANSSRTMQIIFINHILNALYRSKSSLKKTLDFKLLSEAFYMIFHFYKIILKFYCFGI
ncbi:hypothetical protein MCU_00750 [Bartonella elizabethae Re6043vi]|uniref:Uncharacterized protein n=2 Tax=Bartonella elizabethae TaxID=807 RepID=J1KFJ8_BAREL|nr:hypothetical protein MCU_00750 [Bartonella elizabethae Re6043vi]EJF96677.1 hypothetical protein MEE_00576 [Bartonella elizabethae F9251 = ATCC 49927]VEJ40112.1 Uncharacterised protein [Bartonella elizabethae]